MPTSAITVEPLTPTIGATVHGVDLTQPIDEETFQFIYDAWMEHLVLFFRDQPMSPDQHLTFGRMFGDLHIHPAAPYEHGNPELMRIHTDKDSFRNNGERWHSDVSAATASPSGSESAGGVGAGGVGEGGVGGATGVEVAGGVAVICPELPGCGAGGVTAVGGGAGSAGGSTVVGATAAGSGVAAGGISV